MQQGTACRVLWHSSSASLPCANLNFVHTFWLSDVSPRLKKHFQLFAGCQGQRTFGQCEVSGFSCTLFSGAHGKMWHDILLSVWQVKWL